MKSIVARFALQVGHCMRLNAQDTVTNRTGFYALKFFINVLLPEHQCIKDTAILTVQHEHYLQ
eukprot:CAMPEP_0203653154 /NCGR_PEP_ID=MMETSP0088-20131115/31867_1 /ASSEMBLY_ACC=CAM_ASM_001087 /TAXON_ID=426623 /ORGANISM="Chaetoceros affinis, Strain CCMP159" /LENGTH=62 /DNA_ID=CAMNT_0050512975 /DNA_START=107 /DNA_END=295 /DNA_ORIENTATION=+